MKKIFLLILLFISFISFGQRTVHYYPALTTVADTTEFLVWDHNAAATKKVWFVDLQKGVWEGTNFKRNGSGITENIWIGYDAGSGYSSGEGNIGIGGYTMTSLNGAYYNTALSPYCLRNLTNGEGNTALSYGAGYNLTTGDYNFFGGLYAGYATTEGFSNSVLGNHALYSNTTGHNITAIGDSAGFTGTAASFSIYIGNKAGYSNSLDSVLFIDVTSTVHPLIWGNFSTRHIVINGSDIDHNPNERNFFVNGTAGGSGAWNNDCDSTLKKNIITIENGLIKVMRLRGVEFEWKDNREPGKRIGFIAQEVKEIVPEIVEGEEGSMSIQTSQITALLVEAVKQQQRQIRILYIACGIMFILFLVLLIKN